MVCRSYRIFFQPPFLSLARQSTNYSVSILFIPPGAELQIRSGQNRLGYFMLVKPALTGSSKRECLGLPGILSQASEQSLTSSALRGHGASNTECSCLMPSQSSRRACSSISASFRKVFVLSQLSYTTQQST